MSEVKTLKYYVRSVSIDLRFFFKSAGAAKAKDATAAAVRGEPTGILTKSHKSKEKLKNMINEKESI
jgi:hypothetical protein